MRDDHTARIGERPAIRELVALARRHDRPEAVDDELPDDELPDDEHAGGEAEQPVDPAVMSDPPGEDPDGARQPYRHGPGP